ncbi:hypothetical protein H5410_046346 [Solanum commersonii]|uniref:Uncharacterized protein n=1 Tax=Solanum commersonii TaxID=4109 RepID=A0A9J5XG82_SOLCO|nr:hypothetical protein H5410_046346 [Solanum commersonii]
MFGKEKGLVLENEVRVYMDLMFGEYVKSLSKDKNSNHSSSLSISSFEKFSSLPSSLGSTVQSIGSLGFTSSFIPQRQRTIDRKGETVEISELPSIEKCRNEDEGKENPRNHRSASKHTSGSKKIGPECIGSQHSLTK